MGPASVLIIANPVEARILGRAVDLSRYRCTVAEGGEGALERLREGAPDFVILARGLYAIEDDEMLAGLQSHRPAPSLVVIDDGTTGWPPPGVTPAAVLRRPIDAAALAAALLAAAEGGGQRAAGGPAAMLRLDDALGLEALATASRSPGLPVGRGGGAEEGSAGAAPDRPHVALDSLPGIDDELGLGAGAAIRRAQDRAAAVAASPAVIVDAAGATGLLPEAAVRPRPALEAGARVTPGGAEAVEPVDVPDVGEAGDLAREGVAVVIARLHRAGYTGRLTLRHGESQKVVFFDGGLPVHATSSLPHDRLGEVLWREGKVSREQLARARVVADERGQSLVEALVETSALRRDEVFQTMRHLVEEIVYSAFGWDRGAWALDRELARRADMVSVAHPYAIVVEGVRRKYSLERLVAAVGAAATAVAPAASLWRVSADAALLGGEREAIQQLRRGTRTVAELRAAGGLDEIGAYALVHGLHALGAVELGEGAAERAPPSLDASDGPTADTVAIARARVLAKHAQVLDGDYFAVLGTTRAATTYEIRRAYERSRAEFQPSRFPPALVEELGVRLADIADSVDEAFRALSDERLREVYRSHLAG